MKYVIIPNTVAIVDVNVTTSNIFDGSNTRKQQQIVLNEKHQSPNRQSVVKSNYGLGQTVCNQLCSMAGKKIKITFNERLHSGSPSEDIRFNGMIQSVLGLSDEAYNDIGYPILYSDSVTVVAAKDTDQTYQNNSDWPKKYAVSVQDINTDIQAPVGVISANSQNPLNSFNWSSYANIPTEKTVIEAQEYVLSSPKYENSADDLLVSDINPSLSSGAALENLSLGIDTNVNALSQTAFILLRDTDVEIEYQNNNEDLTVEYYYLVASNSGSKHYKMILAHNEYQGEYIAKWERTDTSVSRSNNKSVFVGYPSKLCEDLYDVHYTDKRKVRDDQNNLTTVNMNRGAYMKHKALTLTQDVVIANTLPMIVLFNEDGSVKKIIYHNKTNETSGQAVSNNIGGAANYNARNVLSDGNANPKIDYTYDNYLSMLKQIGYKHTLDDVDINSIMKCEDYMNTQLIGLAAYDTGNRFFKAGVLYPCNSVYVHKAKRSPAWGSNVSHPHDGFIGISLGISLGPIIGMTPAEDLIGFNYTLKDGSNNYNTNTSCISSSKLYLTDKTFFTDYIDLHDHNQIAYTGNTDANGNTLSVSTTNPTSVFQTALEIFPSINTVPSRSKVTLNSADGNIYTIENTSTNFDNITREYSIAITGKLPTPGTGQNPDDGNQGEDNTVTIPNYEPDTNNYIKW